MRRIALVAIPLLAVAGPAHAWDYPRPTLMESLPKGTLAFRGRVEALRQVKRTPMVTEARASVRVAECLYGLGCSEGLVVEVEYWPQSIAEEVDDCFGYPTDLPLGGELVFVFFRQTMLRDGVPFNTCLRANGSGAAFVLSAEADGSPPRDGAGREDRYAWTTNLYARTREEGLTVAVVQRLARDRRAELAQD